MKKINLATAIYSLVTSIIFLIAPLLTLGAIFDEAANNSASSNSQSIDVFFRVVAFIIIVLAIILLVKDKVSSLAGKILLIICGALVVIFSSLVGFIAGIVGIVGASLLLASNKKYCKEVKV